MSGGGQIPIFDALALPPQVMGCERRWFVLSVATAAMIVGPAGLFSENLVIAFVGVMLGSVAIEFGRRWTAQDAHFRDVYVEAFRYERTYVAESRWDVPVPPARSWR